MDYKEDDIIQVSGSVICMNFFYCFYHHSSTIFLGWTISENQVNIFTTRALFR